MATMTRGSITDLLRALDDVNPKYGGNLKFGGSNTSIFQTGRGSEIRFTLGVNSTKGRGARLSRPTSYSKQRRINAACWHAYRDFFIALFERQPNATVRTSMATYDGLAGFEAYFPDTYFNNAGSMMEPAYYGTLCECSGYDDPLSTECQYGLCESCSGKIQSWQDCGCECHGRS